MGNHYFLDEGIEDMCFKKNSTEVDKELLVRFFVAHLRKGENHMYNGERAGVVRLAAHTGFDVRFPYSSPGLPKVQAIEVFNQGVRHTDGGSIKFLCYLPETPHALKGCAWISVEDICEGLFKAYNLERK